LKKKKNACSPLAKKQKGEKKEEGSAREREEHLLLPGESERKSFSTKGKNHFRLR